MSALRVPASVSGRWEMTRCWAERLPPAPIRAAGGAGVVGEGLTVDKLADDVVAAEAATVLALEPAQEQARRFAHVAGQRPVAGHRRQVASGDPAVGLAALGRGVEEAEVLPGGGVGPHGGPVSQNVASGEDAVAAGRHLEQRRAGLQPPSEGGAHVTSQVRVAVEQGDQLGVGSGERFGGGQGQLGRRPGVGLGRPGQRDKVGEGYELAGRDPVPLEDPVRQRRQRHPEESAPNERSRLHRLQAVQLGLPGKPIEAFVRAADRGHVPPDGIDVDTDLRRRTGRGLHVRRLGAPGTAQLLDAGQKHAVLGEALQQSGRLAQCPVEVHHRRQYGVGLLGELAGRAAIKMPQYLAARPVPVTDQLCQLAGRPDQVGPQRLEAGHTVGAAALLELEPVAHTLKPTDRDNE
jgi:hypothetical protein